jgi:integrase
MDGRIVGVTTATIALIVLRFVALGLFTSLPGLLIAGFIAAIAGSGAGAVAEPGTVRDSTILTVAVYSGLRRGELFALQWADVDFYNGRVSVRRSVYQGDVTTPKTEHSMRIVDVPASLLATLAIYRAYFPALNGGYIFRTTDGAPLDPDNRSKRVLADVVARAGVRPIGLHGLRHTYASLLINQGEHIKYVSRQLGHASIQITADLYGHLFSETSQAAMRRLDARLTGGGKVVPLATGTHG